jgi:hypothetical protein
VLVGRLRVMNPSRATTLISLYSVRPYCLYPPSGEISGKAGLSAHGMESETPGSNGPTKGRRLLV